jgi:RNA polymerase sigma-70 factor (ECF subfamily)
MHQERRSEDAAAVAQVLAGDREAYAFLVQRHSRSIFGIACRVTGNEQDAEEVVQETFLRAYKNLSRFEQRANFGTWLYRIAMNCALDHKEMRDRKHPAYGAQISEDPEPGENEIQVASTDPGQEQLIFGAQVKKRIGEAMLLLSKTERAAFVMRHLEGRSIEEISGVLGIKTNAAKNCIFRAVQKMRQELGPLVNPSTHLSTPAPARGQAK